MAGPSHVGAPTEKNWYFVFAAGSMFAAEIRVTGSSLDPGVPRTLFGMAPPSTNLAHPSYNRFAVAADGQRFLISQPTGGGGLVAGGGLSDAIIASVDRGGTTPGSTPNAVSVVLNWQQLLKAK